MVKTELWAIFPITDWLVLGHINVRAQYLGQDICKPG